ncbi:Tyrosine-protein kinase YwqD (plasmid) [Bacillus cereus]|uniref:CpsD/CapB family tyrosine-protein kinase n=1 Tax=Bacillus cereus group TaxID=86661 RepID=UPI00074493CF|nr:MULTISPECIES: CpsD/CapB family tyrosine-protein kinase [Bacillus cereus group]ALZ64664.1 Tyrosine-protein kinase YwqD [Bacillus cereus]MEC2395197.1 CpsD/CapB family tyrosine-protein kinase [Bacillus toyonensis]OTX33669.1 tyrosine protein kinase [Bacillus thuringiensis serovar malayensis]OUB08515.1 tyrosine protein kinase [Bacillus thuringiensis serovar shandongiensis]
MVLKKKVIQGRRQPIVYEQPGSFVAEQYRNIRTSIEFTSVDKRIRSLMVTSSNASEGKTTTAVNIAIAFAQQDKKVLLIDADLRKPVLHQMMQVDNSFGLTSVLTRSKNLETCVKHTKIENLDILPCGPIPPNPSELLGARSMKDMLSEAYGTYELLIFDTAPILLVTDAKIMANQCDASVLVIRSGVTEKGSALKGKKELDSAEGKLLGVILNDKETQGEEDYYYGS